MRHGQAMRWAVPVGGRRGGPLAHEAEASPHRDEARRHLVGLCDRGCSTYGYFAVGSPTLADGPCACFDLETISWERDRRGLAQLSASRLAPLPRPKG